MGVLKQGLRCDCDRLQNQADGHIKIRQMLGHGNLDESEYELQTIRNSAKLMTPELLREAGRLIARADAKLSRKKSGAAARSWWRRTSTIRPTSTCCGTRSAACFGRRRGTAAGRRGLGAGPRPGPKCGKPNSCLRLRPRGIEPETKS